MIIHIYEVHMSYPHHQTGDLAPRGDDDDVITGQWFPGDLSVVKTFQAFKITWILN